MGPKTRSKTLTSKKKPEKNVEHLTDEEEEEDLLDDVDEESKLNSEQ